MISHSRLKELLDYDPNTGTFTRKVSLNSNTKVGDVAGNLTHGYVELSVEGVTYRAHNLAWFYMTGRWPNGLIDHRNLDKSNNSFRNLREAKYQQNSANTARQRNNSLGLKGVTRHGNKFKAAVTVNRKRHHLGVFDCPRAAAEAYDKAAAAHFGEFARTNRQLGYI